MRRQGIKALRIPARLHVRVSALLLSALCFCAASSAAAREDRTVHSPWPNVAESSQLATTTVIAHGFTTGSKGSWVQAMGQAILARAGGGSLYRYEGSTGVWTYVPVAEGDGSSQHVVLIFNWVPESASPSPGPNWNYVQAAADVMDAMLRSPRYAGQAGPMDLLNGRLVQFIGHSRGACVVSEAIRRLALAGIGVDQMTTHDPHPVNGTLDSPYNYDWGDPVPVRWSNTTWADNYWRADGGGLINGLDFDGISLANVYNTPLSESALNCCGYSFSHSDVHLWYHGTIDTSATANDGEQAITAQMRSTWWTNPGGYTQAGFFYSALGGGAAQRPSIPAGTPATAVESIVNGDFAQGTYAGWGYHGGSVNGAIVVESGVSYIKLGAGQGNGAGGATHNRFYLPSNASAIGFDYRVLTAAAGESLRFTLTDVAANANYVIGSVPVSAVSGWITNQTLPLGCAPPRGRLYTLTVQIVANGGPISSVVGVDNIRYTTANLPADITGDGMVNVSDLLAVINSWGSCPLPCPPNCAADTNHDCAVNVSDLLAVINSWSACP